MIIQFGDILLDWYQTHARSLPWRNQIDPYLVWISEIMLQQTQVETVIPYFKRWVEVFPTIDSLASASQQEVLAVWEGLGYYSRARNLHRAAQHVRAEYGGHLPREVNQLCQLPGIGRSTAGAIASIAFGMDEPVLDGNIRRVLARLFDVREPSRSAAGEKRLWELAQAHIPPGKAGDYNQALMDLGALVCIPQHPRCEVCPLNTICAAYASGMQEERPIRLSKPTPPHHVVSSAIIQKNHQVLIAQRPPDGLLGSMWEFPGGKVEAGEDLITGLKREICEELGVEILVGSPFGVYHHAYTHFRVTLHAFFCKLNGSQPRSIFHSQLAWCDIASLPDYPMGKIDRQISTALLTLEEAG
ncbi:MAG: A/G-specific adenine glycosylase [Anaerolineales bacterium]